MRGAKRQKIDSKRKRKKDIERKRMAEREREKETELAAILCWPIYFHLIAISHDPNHRSLDIDLVLIQCQKNIFPTKEVSLL